MTELTKKRRSSMYKNPKHVGTQRISGVGPPTLSASDYFLAYVIFMAQVAVILKPCSASLATPACVSLSNSTKEMSCLPGTSRTSLNPGNLDCRKKIENNNIKNRVNKRLLKSGQKRCGRGLTG